jgi:hypothetical protein
MSQKRDISDVRQWMRSGMESPAARTGSRAEGRFRHGAMTASGSYSCVEEKTAIGGQLRAHPLLELVVVIN